MKNLLSARKWSVQKHLRPPVLGPADHAGATTTRFVVHDGEHLLGFLAVDDANSTRVVERLRERRARPLDREALTPGCDAVAESSVDRALGRGQHRSRFAALARVVVHRLHQLGQHARGAGAWGARRPTKPPPREPSRRPGASARRSTRGPARRSHRLRTRPASGRARPRPRCEAPRPEVPRYRTLADRRGSGRRLRRVRLRGFRTPWTPV